MTSSTFQRALFVGGTSGIGRSMALKVANESNTAQVTIAARSIERAAKEIKDENAAKFDNIGYAKVDCISIKDIKRFTGEIEHTHGSKPFDLLVLSPGILTLSGFTPTEDGLDRKFALHYYCRMLIIRDLLRSGCLTSDAVVMSVLDGLKSNPGSFTTFPDDASASLTKLGSYSIKKCAEYATAFNDMQLHNFGAQAGNEDRLFIHPWPGLVKTALGQNLPIWARAGMNVLAMIMGKTAEECATNMLRGIEVARLAKQGDQNSRCSFNIDASGKLLDDKVVNSDEVLGRCDEHTWAMTDK